MLEPKRRNAVKIFSDARREKERSLVALKAKVAACEVQVHELETKFRPPDIADFHD